MAFKVLDDSAVDTTNRTGKLVMGILALIAEFETEIRCERQMEGIAKAKAEGRTGGWVTRRQGSGVERKSTMGKETWRHLAFRSLARAPTNDTPDPGEGPSLP